MPLHGASTCLGLCACVLLATSRGQQVDGPVAGAVSGNSQAGWVLDVSNPRTKVPALQGGEYYLNGNSRAYLVQDYTKTSWGEHKYVRFDLHEHELSFQVDLSNVPCGCLACAYLVAMEDPSQDGSNYCDMAENVHPGLNGATCTEIDLFEANNWAMQTALHTELGGSYGSGNCDENGCFARVGGPNSPGDMHNLYGPGKKIDSFKPFRVHAKVDGEGELKIRLTQGSTSVTTFDKHLAGNPNGNGLPHSALQMTKLAMGKLALVISMWSDDLSWLDGDCKVCTLADAYFTVSDIKYGGSGAAAWPVREAGPAPKDGAGLCEAWCNQWTCSSPEHCGSCDFCSGGAGSSGVNCPTTCPFEYYKCDPNPRQSSEFCDLDADCFGDVDYCRGGTRACPQQHGCCVTTVQRDCGAKNKAG